MIISRKSEEIFTRKNAECKFTLRTHITTLSYEKSFGNGRKSADGKKIVEGFLKFF